jgi:hypothetical protein
MPRQLAVAAVIFLICPVLRAAPQGPPPGAAAAAVVEDVSVRIPWDASTHKLFFNYQRYLASADGKEFVPETEETWAAFNPEEQHKKVADTEEFLKAKLAKMMASDSLNDNDQALIKAVWGDPVLAGVKRAAAAQAMGDPAQIKQATEQTTKLVKQVGGSGVDWTGVFDGGLGGVSASEPAFTKDYLKPETKSGFLDSLSTPETQRILASQKSYGEFLSKHGVSEQAMPGMMAMYQVLSQAKGPEKAELSHLLPTVVTFLKDGKKVSYDAGAGPGAYGYAVPGEYDHPEQVKVTPAVIGADATIVGKTLSHEFQHIYDMYTGRYYTLDSEMRGFKTAVLYFKALKQEAPAKYQSMAASDNDETRGIIRDVESYSRDYDESPQKFREAVAVRYQSREEGVFSGRMSLRETVDPRLESGAVVDLAMYRSRLATEQSNVAALEARQAEVQAQMAAKSDSRTLDKELEKAAKDLAGARHMRDALDQDVTIKQIRLKRMQSEVQWLDRRAAAAGQDAPPYDLTLPVDRAYVTP